MLPGVSAHSGMRRPQRVDIHYENYRQRVSRHRRPGPVSPAAGPGEAIRSLGRIPQCLGTVPGLLPVMSGATILSRTSVASAAVAVVTGGACRWS